MKTFHLPLLGQVHIEREPGWPSVNFDVTRDGEATIISWGRWHIEITRQGEKDGEKRALPVPTGPGDVTQP